MTTIPDQWDEVMLVGIQEINGSEIAFGSLTDDITDISFMEKNIEGKNNVAGGVTTRKIPVTPIESITLKMTPITVGLMNETTGTGITQHMHPQSAADNTEPIDVPVTLNRSKYKLVFLWATTLPATASTLPAAGVYAKRWEIFNAYITNVNWDYGEKELTAEVTFKWTSFQKDATRNRIMSSTDDSAQLTAVVSYS